MRDGWAHRDLLRLAHAKPADEQHQIIFGWLVKGWDGVGEAPHPDPALLPLWAFERAKRATDARDITALIASYRLPREAIPTRWLDDAGVWAALLPHMPLEALVRNLATLTRLGLIAPGSDGAAQVVAQLGDVAHVRAARLHPIKVLAALLTYSQGHGVRGHQQWTPVADVIDALDGAFYTAFGNVTPTRRRWLLALDVSGSMDGGVVGGVPGLTPRVAGAAMALITARTEARRTIVAFSAARGGPGGRFGGGTPGLTPLRISPRQRLDDVVQATAAIPMGGTDCALPMIWAREQKLPIDVFVVYTDSETWAGEVHPAQALRQYREATGIRARLIVVGMVSNGFSIADPTDAGMLDVVGFDTATPQVLADFATAGHLPVAPAQDDTA